MILTVCWILFGLCALWPLSTRACGFYFAGELNLFNVTLRSPFRLNTMKRSYQSPVSETCGRQDVQQWPVTHWERLFRGSSRERRQRNILHFFSSGLLFVTEFSGMEGGRYAVEAISLNFLRPTASHAWRERCAKRKFWFRQIQLIQQAQSLIKKNKLCIAYLIIPINYALHCIPINYALHIIFYLLWPGYALMFLYSYCYILY